MIAIEDRHKVKKILKEKGTRFQNFARTKKGRSFITFTILLLCYWFCLPSTLFNEPTSTVLEDANGKLLAARIAEDGQWRFPLEENVPEKFAKAITTYEDKYFYNHPGVNPVSLFRALRQNISKGEVVSGGSTLTMQLMRIARKNKSRNIFQKTIEVIQATRAEIRYSKNEILALYAANAPFGGNVVGLEAASWRYFGRNPNSLSWAEAATLAVLPNSPGLIYPGRNQEKLLKKRNRLLDEMKVREIIDQETCNLSKLEPLPQKPFPLPDLCMHLLDRAISDGHKGKRIRTTVNSSLQNSVSTIVDRHNKILMNNEINNAAVLVLDVHSGKSLAYIGNTKIKNAREENGNQVDVINRPRSTGSILKPFLFAAMLKDGLLLPETLVPDIPTQLTDFAPENFNYTYDGAVPARNALARSLNIPAVRMLQDYKVERFHEVLNSIGLTTITRPANDYGLSLILGGAEGKLWDLAGAYASMARVLNTYNKTRTYKETDFHAPYYLSSDSIRKEKHTRKIFDASSIWHTFEAMVEVNRPDEESAWRDFTSARKIAWKTGTSFGFRDGWAIGVTPDHVVAVWTGNADGEGRPGLIGVETAAPILFEVFGLLKSGNNWFKEPYEEMSSVTVCTKSGYQAGSYCEKKTIRVPPAGKRTLPCPFHKMVHLDASGKYRVNAQCENESNIIHQPWFILPPGMEWYYKSKNSTYEALPPLREDCRGGTAIGSLEIVYPANGTKIYVPVELNGKPGKAVFEAATRRKESFLFWHLDDNFSGTTSGFHQLGLNPEAGKHKLTVVDESGESVSVNFEIISKDHSNK